MIFDVSSEARLSIIMKNVYRGEAVQTRDPPATSYYKEDPQSSYSIYISYTTHYHKHCQACGIVRWGNKQVYGDVDAEGEGPAESGVASRICRK